MGKKQTIKNPWKQRGLRNHTFYFSESGCGSDHLKMGLGDSSKAQDRQHAKKKRRMC